MLGDIRRTSTAASLVLACLLVTGCASEPAEKLTQNEQDAADAANAAMNAALNSSQESNTTETVEETPAERKARLREKAKTDPDGADAEAIDHMSQYEVLATGINSAGFLCARVTDVQFSNGDMIVKCIEYRSGEGRVRYRIDAHAGTVEQLD